MSFPFFRKQKYEILLNVNFAAKLDWRPYGRYLPVPEGAVAAIDSNSDSDHIYVGRYKSPLSGTSSLYEIGIGIIIGPNFV